MPSRVTHPSFPSSPQTTWHCCCRHRAQGAHRRVRSKVLRPQREEQPCGRYSRFDFLAMQRGSRRSTRGHDDYRHATGFARTVLEGPPARTTCGRGYEERVDRRRHGATGRRVPFALLLVLPMSYLNATSRLQLLHTHTSRIHSPTTAEQGQLDPASPRATSCRHTTRDAQGTPHLLRSRRD
ncbi:hypothetical protein L226DRAFT_298240 [Lentinus tigrinus ALCF2SS1-7]|uniref:uncharacterized protein n=1 Tax=Lentinus tigrinus ALCF2SS1-7 TaxID=1328758 RepID=UPI0011661ED9|nr:hypothetical protein L226DRAFT_298240 [Lentinus tigrinus ALCF2SS1-7]